MKPMTAPLMMPRRFAIQLLHEAQLAGAHGFLAAVAAKNLPDTYFVAEPTIDLAALLIAADARFRAQSRQLWAIYQHRPDQPAMPTAADFDSRPEVLRLSASLATKGVLQLRAWAIDANGCVIERELQLDD
jgi:hypothetical protein